jgi:hypothetical protein
LSQVVLAECLLSKEVFWVHLKESQYAEYFTFKEGSTYFLTNIRLAASATAHSLKEVQTTAQSNVKSVVVDNACTKSVSLDLSKVLLFRNGRVFSNHSLSDVIESVGETAAHLFGCELSLRFTVSDWSIANVSQESEFSVAVVNLFGIWPLVNEPYLIRLSFHMLKACVSKSGYLHKGVDISIGSALVDGVDFQNKIIHLVRTDHSTLTVKNVEDENCNLQASMLIEEASRISALQESGSFYPSAIYKCLVSCRRFAIYGKINGICGPVEWFIPNILCISVEVLGTACPNDEPFVKQANRRKFLVERGVLSNEIKALVALDSETVKSDDLFRFGIHQIQAGECPMNEFDYVVSSVSSLQRLSISSAI